MNDAVIAMLGVVVAAAISLSGVVYVQRSTKDLRDADNDARVTAVQHTVEAGAYERARASYEAAIRRYEGEQARMQGRIDALEIRVDHAEARATRAELFADLLKSELTRRGIPVPDFPPDLG